MTWFMELLRIYLQQQLLIKYCKIKHLILLKIQNMMNITSFNGLQIFQKFNSLADKSAAGSVIENENLSNEELAKELHQPIIRKFEKQVTKNMTGPP